VQNEPEEDTAARAIDGDHAALVNLLEQNMAALQAFVRATAGRGLLQFEEHDDLVQSVCREILDHADRFQHPRPEAFRRWLFSEARRKVLSRRRHHHAQRRDAARIEVSDEPDALERLLGAYRSFTSPSAGLQKREQVERIETALERLPEDQRTVVLLAHLGQWSRNDIAAEIGRSSGAVRMLLHRALATLAVELTD